MNPDVVWGLALGLSTALFHALAYLAARQFSASGPAGPPGPPDADRRPARSGLWLLTLAHLWMAAAAAAAVPVLWPAGLTPTAAWLGPLAGLVAAFSVAQWLLLGALRHIDPSRVAPLLSLKIAALGGLATLRGETLTAGRWGAVGLAVAGSLVLGGTGGRVPLAAAGRLLGACGLYAVCDDLILRTIRGVEAVAAIDPAAAPWAGPCFTVAAVYLALGGPALLLFLVLVRRRAGPAAWRADALAALPYATCWLLAMVTLYGTFARVGTVLGAIFQSTRGLIAIGLGVALAAAGFEHLERKTPAGVVVRRALAAAAMLAAVWLYVR